MSEEVEEMTDEQYGEEISVILEHAGILFIQVRLDHVKYLGGDGTAALVLSYILNLLKLKNMSAKERELLIRNQMWFKCPAGKVISDLGMGEERHRTAVKNLINHDMLLIQRRAGNVVWVRVNTDTLKTVAKKELQMLREAKNPDTANPGNREPRKPGTPGTRYREPPELDTANTGISTISINNYSKNESNNCRVSDTVRAAETNGVGFLGKVKSKSSELAEQFHAVILKHNKIMRRPNMGAWSRAFAELLKQRTYEQITEAIGAHDKHLDDRYWPKLYAATTFCTDFVKIEDAIARYKDNDKQPEVVVASPRAEQLALTIAQELGRRSADEELEIGAQKCLDFTGHFFGKVLPAASKCFPGGENTSEFRFANALMDMFHGEEELIRTYYVKEKWRDYTPPLSADCKWFRNWGRKLAEEYCGDAQVWDNLVDGAKME